VAASGERIEVRKWLPASAAEVFSAWTDAEEMREWMRPSTTTDLRASLDVRVGGRYTLDMIDGEKVFSHHGEYVTVDPPWKLSFTWRAAWLPEGSLVTVELFEREGGTELVLTHERLPSAESAKNHGQGWTEILEKLGGVMEKKAVR
jgi:uncharacterized protein YndB with AHSA1/START domain